MQRISVLGGPGSGKTTLARALGQRLGLPVVHLDMLFWRPGWVESDRDELAARVAAITARKAWVIEGNYASTWPSRLAHGDSFILLDMPTPLRLWRVVRRSLRHWGQTRPDLPEGCPEQLDLAFLRFSLRYRGEPRGRALALLAQAAETQDCHRLRSVAEVRRFLAALPGEPGLSGPPVRSSVAP